MSRYAHLPPVSQAALGVIQIQPLRGIELVFQQILITPTKRHKTITSFPFSSKCLFNNEIRADLFIGLEI